MLRSVKHTFEDVLNAKLIQVFHAKFSRGRSPVIQFYLSGPSPFSDLLPCCCCCQHVNIVANAVLFLLFSFLFFFVVLYCFCSCEFYEMD